jgi:hypothetical protein
VALTEFASSSFPAKVHLKKKSGGRKTRRSGISNQIPYSLPSNFFRLRFFLGVNFCGQTPGTCLHHTVLLVGVTDRGNSGVFIFESLIYIGISTFSNAHNFVKNLVWTSFYSQFWNSWADLSFAPTFRVWRQILFFLLALLVKDTVDVDLCHESKFRVTVWACVWVMEKHETHQSDFRVCMEKPWENRIQRIDQRAEQRITIYYVY